jgi:Raf kinase inhibitor-like YbhB/YbcL family protein
MRYLWIVFMMLTWLQAENFTLASDTLKGQISKAQEFNGFGCNGQNISPQLHWSHPPKETKSFAITVYDPDAPTGSGWWHWLVVNIPAATQTIPADASAKHALPKGAVETMTDFGSAGFGGACPPKGDKAHRYVFTVYALDVESLDVKAQSDSALVGFMIKSHTIQKASLISYYQRD